MTEAAKPSPVLPGTLRVQGSSRAALGATTAALISLASGGTAMLVAHGTQDLTTPTSLPGGLLSELPNLSGPVVVARAPGATPATPAAAPAPAPDPTELALREALTRRLPPTGPRTLVVPLVDLGGSGIPPVPPVPPARPGGRAGRRPGRGPADRPADRPADHPAATAEHRAGGAPGRRAGPPQPPAEHRRQRPPERPPERQPERPPRPDPGPRRARPPGSGSERQGRGALPGPQARKAQHGRQARALTVRV